MNNSELLRESELIDKKSFQNDTLSPLAAGGDPEKVDVDQSHGNIRPAGRETSNFKDVRSSGRETSVSNFVSFAAVGDIETSKNVDAVQSYRDEYVDTEASLGNGVAYFTFMFLYGNGKYVWVPFVVVGMFMVLMGSNIYHQVASTGEHDVAPYNITLYIVYTSMVAANCHFAYTTLKRNMIGKLLRRLPTSDYKGRNTRVHAMKILTRWVLYVLLVSFLANCQKIFPQLKEVFHYEGLFFNSTEFNSWFFALIQLGFVVNMYCVDYMLIMLWLWYCSFTLRLYQNKVIRHMKKTDGIDYAISGKLMEDFLEFFTELQEENKNWYLNHVYRSISAILVAVVCIRQIYFYADLELWIVVVLYLYLFLTYYLSIWATFITAGLCNERMENELFHSFHFLKPRTDAEATLLLLYETQITNSFKDYSGLRVAGLRITTKLGIILGSGTIVVLTTLVRLKIIG